VNHIFEIFGLLYSRFEKEILPLPDHHRIAKSVPGIALVLHVEEHRSSEFFNIFSFHSFESRQNMISNETRNIFEIAFNERFSISSSNHNQFV
jgi:hypothetical protein